MARPPSFTEWAPFLAMTADRDASDALLRALEFISARDANARQAIDLGCGGGADTRTLLARGWRVVAVDVTQDARGLLLDRVKDADERERLDIRIGAFDQVELPSADLVFAQMSLPFAYDTFDASVDAALGSVAPGGVFAGHFFGARDEWVTDGPAVGISRDRVDELFGGWSDMTVDEVDAEGEFVGGQSKYWHYYFVRARKPS